MNLVEIEIVLSDSIINVEADYLILKNVNEGLYGPEFSVDKASRGAISLFRKSHINHIEAVNILHNLNGILAKGIILVDMGLGFELRYKTISTMCHKAIQIISQSDPLVEVIATVSHGVGFGLDRKEIFLTQISSFKSALEQYEKTLKLNKIIFNEINLSDADRLKLYLEELTSKINSPIVKESNKYFIQLGEASEYFNELAARISEEQYVFIAMPFATDFENVYDFAISLPIVENQLQPIRTDKEFFIGPIAEKIKKRIHDSILVIADISTLNPNVMYELGFAEGCGKTAIIICRSGEKLPFDVAGMNVIFYDPNLLRELKKSISKALKELSHENKEYIDFYTGELL